MIFCGNVQGVVSLRLVQGLPLLGVLVLAPWRLLARRLSVDALGVVHLVTRPRHHLDEAGVAFHVPYGCGGLSLHHVLLVVVADSGCALGHVELVSVL